MNKGESVFEIYKNHWLIESNKALVRQKWYNIIHKNLKSTQILSLRTKDQLSCNLEYFRSVCYSILQTFYKGTIYMDDFITIYNIPTKPCSYPWCMYLKYVDSVCYPIYDKEVFDRVWAYI